MRYIPTRVSIRDDGNTIIKEALVAEPLPNLEQADQIISQDKKFIADCQRTCTEHHYQRAHYYWIRDKVK